MRGQGWFLFVIMTLVSASFAQSPRSASRGLVLELRQDQDFMEIEATSPSAIAYALAFAKGEAAPLSPGHCTLSNPTKQELLLCQPRIQLLSVRDCRSGPCLKLRGLYAGRRPFTE